MKHTGNVKNLLAGPMTTWKGWVLYYWDHYHGATLFETRPRKDPDGGWFLDSGKEINPSFLQALGIHAADVALSLDGPGNDKHAFYYGKGCSEAMHPPIAIEIKAPQALIDEICP